MKPLIHYEVLRSKIMKSLTILLQVVKSSCSENEAIIETLKMLELKAKKRETKDYFT